MNWWSQLIWFSDISTMQRLEKQKPNIKITTLRIVRTTTIKIAITDVVAKIAFQRVISPMITGYLHMPSKPVSKAYNSGTDTGHSINACRVQLYHILPHK